jgi:hypothetical protein
LEDEKHATHDVVVLSDEKKDLRRRIKIKTAMGHNLNYDRWTCHYVTAISTRLGRIPNTTLCDDISFCGAPLCMWVADENSQFLVPTASIIFCHRGHAWDSHGRPIQFIAGTGRLHAVPLQSDNEAVHHLVVASGSQ